MTAEAKPRRAKKVEQAENSVALRVLCALMGVLCLAAASIYVNNPAYITFIYLWGALSGSYISYNFRHSKSRWLTSLTVIFLLLVLGNFLQEVWGQLQNPRMDPLVPFIHVLTGLLALHTFDLRTRTDININVLISIGLFACAMVLGRDLLFGLLVICYIFLGGLLLYYECAARTRSSGRFAPSEASTYANARAVYRESKGNAMIPIMTLPILTILFFFTLPRIDSLFDFVFDTVRGVAPGMEAGRGGGPGGTGPGGTGPGGIGGGGSGSSGKNTATDDKGQPLGGIKGRTPEEIAEQLNLGGKGPVVKVNQKKVGDMSKVAEAPEEELVFRNKDSIAKDDDLMVEVMTTGDYYYRRMAFDKYDGQKWTISKKGMLSKCRRLNSAYQELGGVPSLFLPLNFQSQEVYQDFRIRGNLGHFIPVVSVPQKIDFPTDPIIVDEMGVVSTPSLLKEGVTYKVVSQVPVYKLEDMRKAATDKETEDKLTKEMANYLQLPKELPQEVRDLAKEAAEEDGNWFVKAERICKYLRQNYKYSNEIKDLEKGKDLVDDFLFSESKEGPCGPFSSSFVVMCRAVGIPAREIGGYSPGEYNGITGYRELLGKNGHAWGEAYVPGWGWVPFDATPTGQLPVPQEEDKSILVQLKKNLQQFEKTINPPRQKRTTTQNGPASASTGSTSTGPGGGSGTGRGGGGTGGVTGKPVRSSKTFTGIDIFKKIPFTWQAALLAISVIPLSVLLFQCLKQLILFLRTEMVKGRPKDAKSSTMLYLKVVDDMKELKVTRHPSDTAADFSQRFFHAVELGLDVHPELPKTFERFMEIYCDDRFGGRENGDNKGKELEALGNQIHTFVRKYHPDKRG